MVWDVEGMEFKVVFNDEQQYSIWPAHKELPAGWHETGKRGLKEDCLANIREIWTDMRPLSLRQATGPAQA